MTYILLAAVVTAAALILIAALLLAARAARLPYRKVDSLLTAAERAFFPVLRQAVAERYEVFPKVRMADLLFVPQTAYKRQEHQNRIFGKHIDFVLCLPGSLAPVLAVELDDSSHRQSKRRERDRFVDRALAAAGLPLLRVPVRRAYQAREVAGAVQERLATEIGQSGARTA